MRRLKAGWVMCRSSAAREKFPLAARARKSSSHERFIDIRRAVLSGHQRRKKQHWRRERLPTIIAWSSIPAPRPTAMKIVEIREKTIPISSPIRNAYIDFSKMTLSLVAVITDVIRDGKPVVGYGFNSNGRYGQGKLMRERFIPRIMEAKPESIIDDSGTNLDPHKIWATMFTNEKPGGHGERSVAIGTIDMAVWDAVAKIEGKPLFQLLADRYGDGKPDRKIFVYAAGGYYYPGQDHTKLKDEMRSYIDRGYTVVKKKIGGASLDEDLRRIDSILSVLQDGQKLCVDANGRFDLDTAIAYAKALSQYDLFWYEEPGDPLDFELQATLRNYYRNPMATGEDLFSMQDARNLIRYGGMRPDRDYLQFDCALSYGLVEYLRTLDMLKEHGWSASRCIPHGGHQMSLNIAAGLGLGGNESYPDLFQPFGGFPDGVKVENSFVTLPDLPGIGFEGKADLYAEMKALSA
jgi:L-alanine-DL-glutamate epimerase-like enolase superfamily enzyme